MKGGWLHGAIFKNSNVERQAKCQRPANRIIFFLFNLRFQHSNITNGFSQKTNNMVVYIIKPLDNKHVTLETEFRSSHV